MIQSDINTIYLHVMWGKYGIHSPHIDSVATQTNSTNTEVLMKRNRKNLPSE